MKIQTATEMMIALPHTHTFCYEVLANFFYKLQQEYQIGRVIASFLSQKYMQ
jgi:hypothetical protein